MVRKVLVAAFFVTVAAGSVLAQDVSQPIPWPPQGVQAVESGQPQAGGGQPAEGPPKESAAGQQAVERQAAEGQPPASGPVAEEAPEAVVEEVPASEPVAEEAPEVAADPVPAPEPVVEEVVEVVVEEVVELQPEPAQPQPEQPQQAEKPGREKAEREKTAKNTVLLDLNPYLFNVLVGQVGKAALDKSMNFSSSGSGFALLYERHLHERFSVAARFDYLSMGTKLGMKLGMEDISDAAIDAEPIDTEAKFDFAIYNFDLQFRAYPLGKILYLGCIFGYSSAALTAKGEMIFENDVIDVAPGGGFEVNKVKEPVEIGYAPAVNSLRIGPALGWRQTFMGSKGPVLEMSLGWLIGVNLGESFLSQIEEEFDISGMDEAVKDAIDIAEKYWLIGGPRLTLSVGWRF